MNFNVPICNNIHSVSSVRITSASPFQRTHTVYIWLDIGVVIKIDNILSLKQYSPRYYSYMKKYTVDGEVHLAWNQTIEAT